MMHVCLFANTPSGICGTGDLQHVSGLLVTFAPFDAVSEIRTSLAKSKLREVTSQLHLLFGMTKWHSATRRYGSATSTWPSLVI